LKIDDGRLELSYTIRNDSERDVWTLVGFDEVRTHAAVFMDEDDQTLVIRTRLDVPSYVLAGSFDGRYVRLRAGETRKELVALALPIHPQRGIEKDRRARGLEYAKRLVLEFGYYSGDLPAMIRRILQESEQSGDQQAVSHPVYPATVADWFGGLWGFNERNEGLRDRDGEVMVPYTHQALTSEQVLRATIDSLLLSYEEKEDSSGGYPPKMPDCTRVEIRFQPSTLDYFFPYSGQRNLLTRAEIDQLRSIQAIVTDDVGHLKRLAHDLSLGIHASDVVRETSRAQVACYLDDTCLTSFAIYNDESVVSEGRYRFIYDAGFPSLRRLTPLVFPLELRVRCAANLKDLWHRLHVLYPPPTEWCDAMKRAHEKTVGMLDEYRIGAHKCPSAGEGENHYAMNPNCKPDSAGDMVLLFETKSGWNQHGGPELFTFDNHDPKGGCVLLNDGTVKFIRTKEELQQLRWK
jgi:hypothetical protein